VEGDTGESETGNGCGELQSGWGGFSCRIRKFLRSTRVSDLWEESHFPKKIKKDDGREEKIKKKGGLGEALYSVAERKRIYI